MDWFINTSSTITASVMNFRRGVLNVKATLPLIIAILLATPVGAYLSQYINEMWVKWLLVGFLLTSGTLLLFQKREAKFAFRSPVLLALLGGGVGVISGLLGVGGGALLIPLLILLGYNAKEAGIAVSMVIPFSSFGAFATYLSFTEMDWPLLGVLTVAAIIGVVLYLLAAKIAY